MEGKCLKNTQNNGNTLDGLAGDNEKFRIKKLNNLKEEWEKINQSIPSKEQIFHTKTDKESMKNLSETYKNDTENIRNMLQRKQINEPTQGYVPNVSSTENMIKYFNMHYRDDYEDRSMKVKLIPSQGNISQNYDIQSAGKAESSFGKTQIRSISNQIKSLQEAKYRLENVLSEAGYKNININFKYGCSNPEINFNAYQSNKDKYQDKIKERLGNL